MTGSKEPVITSALILRLTVFYDPEYKVLPNFRNVEDKKKKKKKKCSSAVKKSARQLTASRRHSKSCTLICLTPAVGHMGKW